MLTLKRFRYTNSIIIKTLLRGCDIQKFKYMPIYNIIIKMRMALKYML